MRHGITQLAFGGEADSNLVRPANGLPVSPSSDQDPIFDHANGVKVSVVSTAGGTAIITPPTGCKYARISSDGDAFITTDGTTPVDDGKSIRIMANQPETIPVVAGITVKGLAASGTAIVRCTPMKVR